MSDDLKRSTFCLDILVKNKSEFDIGGYNVMGSCKGFMPVYHVYLCITFSAHVNVN